MEPATKIPLVSSKAAAAAKRYRIKRMQQVQNWQDMLQQLTDENDRLETELKISRKKYDFLLDLVEHFKHPKYEKSLDPFEADLVVDQVGDQVDDVDHMFSSNF